MPSYKTAFSGYSVEFSPFESNKLAVATSQNFGIIGNGRLYVLLVDEGGNALRRLVSFDTQDALHDCCWSEDNENLIVTASGDGSVKVWDVQAGVHNNPLRSYEGHTAEIYSVDYNLVSKDRFVTGSYDCSARVWSLDSDSCVQQLYDAHSQCVYATIWSPSQADVFASVAGDGDLKIWDTKQNGPAQTIKAHDNEVLTCDWNKYNQHIVVTGSVDKSIKIWDLRNPSHELKTLLGHTYAVRRLKCSPHDENIIASCSYDMSLMIWDTNQEAEPLIEKYEHHNEFVVGLDFNLDIHGQLATCAWDSTVYVWQQGEEPIATHESDPDAVDNSRPGASLDELAANKA